MITTTEGLLKGIPCSCHRRRRSDKAASPWLPREVRKAEGAEGDARAKSWEASSQDSSSRRQIGPETRKESPVGLALLYFAPPPFSRYRYIPRKSKKKAARAGFNRILPTFPHLPPPLDQRRSGFFVPLPQFPSFPTSLNRRWRRRRGREGRHSPMKLGNDPFVSAMHEDEKNISQIFQENVVNASPSPPAINFSITSPHPSSRS